MNPLKHRNVLIGISGGIAIYKVLELLRLLKEKQYQIQVIMTYSATKFIGQKTVQALIGESVYVNQWDTRYSNGMAHIELTRQTDLMIIVPATANIIAKVNLGLADDLLSTTCLARSCPLMIVPAMNYNMWKNSATQFNIKCLKKKNINVLGPVIGKQACGINGDGRMLEAKDIYWSIEASFQKKVMRNKHVLITAGPTYEAIDPIRGITNKSSGKMGFSIAHAAIEAGATVDLISGPCHLDTPFVFTDQVRRYDVVSGKDMYNAVILCLKEKYPDFFFSVAAVADWTIKNPFNEKIKRSILEKPIIELESNPDILKSVISFSKTEKNKSLFCIGFASESHNLKENGKNKFFSKNVQLLIANIGPKTFNSEVNQLLFIEENYQYMTKKTDKLTLSREIIQYVSKRYRAYEKNSTNKNS